jgi:putative membrane protein
MMGGFAGTMGGWGLGMGWGWLMPVAVIGLVVWAFVTYGRPRSDDGHTDLLDDQSLTILRERYANGELDAETYRRMREELKWRS